LSKTTSSAQGAYFRTDLQGRIRRAVGLRHLQFR
jgi:hypothetical protein